MAKPNNARARRLAARPTPDLARRFEASAPSAEPRPDLYHTVNYLDYTDTGARLIKKADLASLSGPCVVVKPAEPK